MAYLLVGVDKNHNPKSEHFGEWYVIVFDATNEPGRVIYRNASKKACVQFAKTLSCEHIHVSNGVSYGARW